MNQTKIIWKKTPAFIETGLMVAAAIATAMMVVSLLTLAEVAQTSTLEDSTLAKPSISVMGSITKRAVAGGSSAMGK